MNEKGSTLLEFIVALCLLASLLTLTAFALQRGLCLRTKEFYAFQKARKALIKKL